MARRVLIAGPPAAGKSTYVQEHAKPGDVVLDYDEIARELGSPDPWDHPHEIGVAAEREMQRRLARLPDDRDAWVIRSAPKREAREALAAEIGADVIVLDVPADEAKARAARDGRPSWTASAIDRWWDRYEPSTDSPAVLAGSTPTQSGQSAVWRVDMADENTPDEGGNGTDGAGEFKPITSQDDLNRIITKRIERERARFADYDEVKQKATEFDKFAEANKTELQKVLERAEAAEKKAAAFEAKEQRTKWAEEIVKDSGVPAAALRGSTKEELQEHFNVLKALVTKPSPTRTATPPGKPSPGDGEKGRAAAALREMRRGG